MSKIIAFMIGMLVGVSIMIGMDYLEARDELAYCTEAENTGCQIEYDGIVGGFNVYWRGE